MLLSKHGCKFKTFLDDYLDEIACFHYHILNWVEHSYIFFNWWFDNYVTEWYQSTGYKLAFRDSHSLPVEKSGMGFLAKMNISGTGFLTKMKG